MLAADRRYARTPEGVRKTVGSRRRKRRSTIASARTSQALPTRSSRKWKKGERKEGEYAGFIILSDDLTKVPPAQFTKTRVLRAVVAGHTLYEACWHPHTVNCR